MANSYFQVDVGVNVGGVTIDATTSNVIISNQANWATATTGGNLIMTGGNINMTTGNIITGGTITMNNTQRNLVANSVVQKSYVDNMSVVFGI